MKRITAAFKPAVIAICVIVAAFAYLAGCSGGGGDASKGTLKLSITDRQSDNFGKVIIAIREIRVVPRGFEGAADNDANLPVLVRFTTPKVIDVMALRFIQEPLGDIILPAGNYSQIRLVLEPNPTGNRPPVNYLTLSSDVNGTNPIPLDTPSGQQSGLKVLGPIEVKAGIINAVMIDFDPNTAIVSRGNGGYNLKPTGIRMVQMANELPQFGSIVGNVSSSFGHWSSATVAIKRRGTVNDTDPIAAGRIFSSYTSGRWQAPFAAFVPAASGSLGYKTFITTNGFALYSSQTVSVVQNQATDLGEIVLTPR
ncbi:lipoprotein, putative [Citrifermentans bemidjiense Bem]|uniref:Lipoprotein, putative n=1 Tax=Citrifermentans bemidjiense (strain ATCC BAA-1014 / DSM 16622 / JCM 12645 / Bem) TaxID=404380 RepID=B5EHX7_CITBB|nr:DUF4382 domain-containing protein [Citrifermentans bemidjiense]ACH39776.1 lipoprotein, putative [Citrifermentans bemidjiense Bem]